MDTCIICFEKKNLTKICSCNYYIHNKCFNKWIMNNPNKCLVCKKNIKISNLLKIRLFFNSLIKNIYDFYCLLCEYDLHNMIKWDKLYD